MERPILSIRMSFKIGLSLPSATVQEFALGLLAYYLAVMRFYWMQRKIFKSISAFALLFANS